ncbi:MAG TPA: ATP-binding protein, partial [Bryobacteraceae bacterium]|nr:ATP-binding protein [Bryobacteraceae bacterium]
MRKGQAAKAAEKSIALEFVGLEGAGQTVLQADSSITRKYGGAGLGLAITRRLVDMYAGQIHVRKRAGEGKRIHVTLLRV